MVLDEKVFRRKDSFALRLAEIDLDVCYSVEILFGRVGGPHLPSLEIEKYSYLWIKIDCKFTELWIKIEHKFI